MLFEAQDPTCNQIVKGDRIQNKIEGIIIYSIIFSYYNTYSTIQRIGNKVCDEWSQTNSVKNKLTKYNLGIMDLKKNSYHYKNIL